MRIFTLIILYVFLNKGLLAKEDVYETDFFIIDINTKNIEGDKIKEIEKVKLLSLDIIIKKILNKSNYNNFKRKIDIKNQINYLIKNIIIEDEFISKNKYTAKVKINFDKEEIISLFRDSNINYSDLNSYNLLLVAYESNSITKEGLSINNSFYKEDFQKNYGLLNFNFPDLSANDRFILPYDKIESTNLSNLKIFSNKYNAKYSVIVKILDGKKFIDIKIYSLDKDKIIYEHEFKNNNNDYKEQILLIIDEWWKNYSIIEQEDSNHLSCFIKSSNIHELYFIISRINSISQIKSFNLIKLNLGMNLYDINFYGNSSNLFYKLSSYQIRNEKKLDKECVLSIRNQ